MERAAGLLGTTPGDLQEDSRPVGVMRQCTFRSRTNPQRTVSFTLSAFESARLAAGSMRSEREAMGDAQTSIDDVMGSKSKDPAVAEVSKIGDEAFYSPLNGAIMLRVGSVIAQVMSPEDLATKARVAEAVAEGLRQ